MTAHVVLELGLGQLGTVPRELELVDRRGRSTSEDMKRDELVACLQCQHLP